MTVKDIFGLIIRTVGLALIVFGAFDMVSLLFRLAGLETAHPEMSTVSVAVAAASFSILGVVVIVLANPITRLAYRRDE